MTPVNAQARRATVDDLVVLRKLWHAAGFSHDALEKRLREFQIIETPDGVLLGAIGLQIDGKQGQLHSETCSQPEREEELRCRLWERVQTVGRNHGLLRIWTTNTSGFWKSKGFGVPTEDQLARCPAGFGETSGDWFVLQLREETSASISVEHEYDVFTEAQRESSERMMRQARLFKNVAYAVLLVLVVLGLLMAALAVLPNSSWSRIFKKPSSKLRQEREQPVTPVVPKQPEPTAKPAL